MKLLKFTKISQLHVSNSQSDKVYFSIQTTDTKENKP